MNFRNNFRRGWERDGAALCVYYQVDLISIKTHGECVVDIWGGFADRECERRWREDTLQIIFSTSKVGWQIEAPIITELCTSQLWLSGSRCDLRCYACRSRASQILRQNIFVLAGVRKAWKGEYNSRDGVSTYGVYFKTYTINECECYIKLQSGLACLDGKISYEDACDHERMARYIEESIIRRTDLKKRGIGQFFKEEIADKHGKCMNEDSSMTD
ncbi:unnamed protein product [Strongylus vulgaris]|uniref:Beta-lactamase-related domain-containing protein n=1 Tax=Strongylus vulgaris TaxID=40348 RepID=A0A3P7J8F4_STRVU|nr:unnamed protein product [Strongylus vulgaris]